MIEIKLHHRIIMPIVALLLIVSACKQSSAEVLDFKINIGNDCVLTPGQEIPVSVDWESLPSETVVSWRAQEGTFRDEHAKNTYYTAPEWDTKVDITVEIEYRGYSSSKSSQCTVRIQEGTSSTNNLEPVTQSTQTQIPNTGEESVVPTPIVADVTATVQLPTPNKDTQLDHGVLLQDNFEEGDVNWQSFGGHWDIRELQPGDNAYCVVTDDQPDQYAFAYSGSEGWTDYAIELTILFNRASDHEKGLMRFRVIHDPIQAYEFTLPLNEHSFLLRMDESSGYRSEWLRDSSFSIKDGQWFKVRIEVVGLQITVIVDGIKLFSYLDDADNYTEGGIGFGAGPGSDLCVNDLVVTALTP